MLSDDPSTPSILDLRPDYVWSRSPLKREAIDRVLSAGQDRHRGAQEPPRSPEGIEAIRLTLAVIADTLMPFAIAPRRISAKERKQIGQRFTALVQILVATSQTSGAPPMLPSDWAGSIFDWLTESESADHAANTPESYEVMAIRYLISFHARLAEKEPGTTAGGPTSRFIAAFFGEMKDALSTATIHPQPSNHASLFAPPTADTIRNRIRELRVEALSPAKLAFIDYIFYNLREQVSQAMGKPTTH